MSTVLTLLVLFVVVVVVLMVAHRLCAVVACRLTDYSMAKNTTISFMPILFMLVGWFFFYQFWNDIVCVVIASLCIIIPLVNQFRTSGWSFWKVLIARLIGLPFFAVTMLLSLIFVRDKEKTVANWDDTQTTYSWVRPAHIEAGDWEINYAYDIGGLEVYESTDGMRCMVSFAPTLGWTNIKFDVIPLYNVKKPLPFWIAWLY